LTGCDLFSSRCDLVVNLSKFSDVGCFSIGRIISCSTNVLNERMKERSLYVHGTGVALPFTLLVKALEVGSRGERVEEGEKGGDRGTHYSQLPHSPLPTPYSLLPTN
jgi:hypothetical protein